MASEKEATALREEVSRLQKALMAVRVEEITHERRDNATLARQEAELDSANRGYAALEDSVAKLEEKAAKSDELASQLLQARAELEAERTAARLSKESHERVSKQWRGIAERSQASLARVLEDGKFGSDGAEAEDSQKYRHEALVQQARATALEEELLAAHHAQSVLERKLNQLITAESAKVGRLEDRVNKSESTERAATFMAESSAWQLQALEMRLAEEQKK